MRGAQDAREGRPGPASEELSCGWLVLLQGRADQDEIASALGVPRLRRPMLTGPQSRPGLHQPERRTPGRVPRSAGSCGRRSAVRGAGGAGHAAGQGERSALNARLAWAGPVHDHSLRPGGTAGRGWGAHRVPGDPPTNSARSPVRMVSLTGGWTPTARLPVPKGEGAGRAADQRDRHPHPHRRLHPGAGGGAQGEPASSRCFKQACGVEQAIVGVGTPHPPTPPSSRGLPGSRRHPALRDRHVPGHPGQFFDASGQVVSCRSTTAGSASSCPTWPRSPRSSGVAGGLHKVEAILGALRGGFLDVLRHQRTRPPPPLTWSAAPLTRSLPIVCGFGCHDTKTATKADLTGGSGLLPGTVLGADTAGASRCA